MPLPRVLEPVYCARIPGLGESKRHTLDKQPGLLVSLVIRFVQEIEV